jgi:hypothetical protein
MRLRELEKRVDEAAISAYDLRWPRPARTTTARWRSRSREGARGEVFAVTLTRRQAGGAFPHRSTLQRGDNALEGFSRSRRSSPCSRRART